MKKKTKLLEMSYEEFEKRYPSPLPKNIIKHRKGTCRILRSMYR